MARSYRGVRPKKDRVYSGDEVMKLYGICRNTLSNWVTSGLRPSDGQVPYVFRGAELQRYHAVRVRPGGPSTLRPGQFKCLGCAGQVFPELKTVGLHLLKTGKKIANATCPDCGATLHKLLNATTWDAFRTCLDTNTSLPSIDEGNGDMHAGIGKDRPKGSNGDPVETRSVNDRIIHHWQGYAGRYDPKTVDAHLAATRDFEAFTGQKPFKKVTRVDVISWREALVAEKDLSRSTIAHRASHVSAFFFWLSGQEGYKGLTALSGYFDLPKKFHQTKVPKPRAYPTMDEATQMLDGMPERTLKDRRDRAIFACAFVCGFRADALISMRLKHVDAKGRKMHHNGAELRAKNGKSFVANWFPRTEAFQAALLAWLDEVQALGLGPDDALFPEIAHLDAGGPLACTSRAAIEPMQSSAAVTEAFRAASKVLGKRYSPHSARDSVINLGDEICRTIEEEKAWSQNMGHSSESVTRRFYAKVDRARQDEIFEAFEIDRETSDDDKDLMLDYHQHLLNRGTPDFERAEALVATRRAKRLAREV